MLHYLTNYLLTYLRLRVLGGLLGTVFQNQFEVELCYFRRLYTKSTQDSWVLYVGLAGWSGLVFCCLTYRRVQNVHVEIMERCRDFEDSILMTWNNRTAGMDGIKK